MYKNFKIIYKLDSKNQIYIVYLLEALFLSKIIYISLLEYFAKEIFKVNHVYNLSRMMLPKEWQFLFWVKLLGSKSNFSIFIRWLTPCLKIDTSCNKLRLYLYGKLFTYIFWRHFETTFWVFWVNWVLCYHYRCTLKYSIVLLFVYIYSKFDAILKSLILRSDICHDSTINLTKTPQNL